MNNKFWNAPAWSMANRYEGTEQHLLQENLLKKVRLLQYQDPAPMIQPVVALKLDAGIIK